MAMTASSEANSAISSSRKRRLRATATKQRLWSEQQSAAQQNDILNRLDHLQQLSTEIAYSLRHSSIHVPYFVPYFACTSEEPDFMIPACDANEGIPPEDGHDYSSKGCENACDNQSTSDISASDDAVIDPSVELVGSGQGDCADDAVATPENNASMTSLPPEALATFERALRGLSGIRRNIAISRLKQISTSTSDDLADLASAVNEEAFLEYLGVLSRLLDKEYALPVDEQIASSNDIPTTSMVRPTTADHSTTQTSSRAASCNNTKVVHAGGKKRGPRSKSHKPHRNASLQPVKRGNSKCWKKQ